MESIQVGTVIRVPQRQRALYKVVSVSSLENYFLVQRCMKSPGFSIDPNFKTTYRIERNSEYTILSEGVKENFTSFIPPVVREKAKKTIKDLETSMFVSSIIVGMFKDLSCQLSPENLCCDGEISHTQAMIKKTKLVRLWRALEQYLGYEVVEF